MEDQSEHNALIRTHLLLKKGEYDAASISVENLLRQYPENQEAIALRSQILLARETALLENKEQDESRRSWRYELQMDSTWRRMGWALSSISIGIFCIWNLCNDVVQGSQRGYSASITSMIYSRGGSWPYTRPIYVDLITNGVGIVLCVVAMVVLWIVSRGAAPWEELNLNDTSRQRYL